MNAGKLKNLILLILTCTVAVLLCIVVPQRLARQQKLQTVRRQVSELFASYDIQLDPEIIPDSVTLYSVEAAQSGFDLAAAAILGDDARREETEMRYDAVYQGENGVLTISRDGSLLARLENSAPEAHPEKRVRELLQQMNVQTSVLRRVTGTSRTVMETELTLLGVPVRTGQMQFTFEHDALVSVEGTGFVGGGELTRVSEETCIGCADALRLLLSHRDDLGWVGSRVQSVKQEYLPTETAESALRFVPVWIIETDTGTLLVNGISREIRALETRLDFTKS